MFIIGKNYGREFLSVVLILAGCMMAECSSTRLDHEAISKRNENTGSIESHMPADLDVGASLFENQKELTLDHVVTAVLRRNASLQAMRHALNAQEERLPQVVSFDDPHLSYGLAPDTFGKKDLEGGQKIILSQTLPWPGKRRLKGAIVAHEWQAMNNDLDALQLKLIEAIKRNFYEYYYVTKALEINATTTNILDELRGSAEIRYAAGTAGKNDVLQAEVEFHHLIHRGIVLTRAWRITRGRINALLHRRPDAPLPPSPSQLTMPTEPADMQFYTQNALASRPELKAISARVRSQTAAVALARKAYFPDVTFMGTYNTMWTRDEHQTMAGIGLDLPLQMGRRRAAVKEAKSRHWKLEADLTDATVRVLREVQEAYEQVVENLHIIDLYRTRLLSAAEENLNAAHSGYRSGLTDLASALIAERSLMETRLHFQRALTDYYQHLAHLERVSGGGSLEIKINAQPAENQ